MSEVLKEQSSSTTNTKPTKAKIQVMVDSALKSLNERSGSSVIAIKKFISGTYSINLEKSSSAIKKYIKESVESGKFIQTKGKNLSGSFKLSKGALKESERKAKPKKPKEGAAEANAKKTKEDKQPKTAKDAASKKKVEPANKKDVQSKKTTEQKKIPALKLTAVAKKKTTDNVKVPKKKPVKKQESETVKVTPKKMIPTGKKAKTPVKKKDKENIPPTKKKIQTKKKDEPSVSPVVEHEDSEDSLTDGSPKLKVKERLSFIESANDVEPDEPSVNSDDNEDGDMEPEDTDNDKVPSNTSDGSVSAEDSIEKPKVKPKGKAGRKPVKKRKSIATLANPAKPKTTKK